VAEREHDVRVSVVAEIRNPPRCAANTRPSCGTSPTMDMALSADYGT
jgi:hypothetical protein